MDNSDSFHIIVLVLSAIIALLLLYYLFSSREHSDEENKQRKGKTGQDRTIEKNTDRSVGKPCPLCGELLMRGERVHSVIYPGKSDKLMEIFGCPYCEKPSAPNKRKCPVCGNQMEDGNVLIARVFDKPGKTHVHVLGCSTCYSGRTRIRKQ
ncbi:MAG: hypothetical protein JEZ04_13385 [Spirochaetales bacterium]|nr:hypothetical protein [Spirochaetales bacterium]